MSCIVGLSVCFSVSYQLISRRASRVPGCAAFVMPAPGEQLICRRTVIVGCAEKMKQERSAEMKTNPMSAARGLAAAILLACCFLFPAAGSAGEKPAAGKAAKTADALLVRPIALPFAIAGTGIYLGTLPLTFLIDTDEPSAELMVRRPWWFAAGRQLGRFDTDAP